MSEPSEPTPPPIIRVPQVGDGGGRMLARILFDAAMQGTPVTAALAAIWGYTHPSQLQQDMAAFHQKIAEMLTDQDQRLKYLEEQFRPRLLLNDQAIGIAVRLLVNDVDGLGKGTSFAELAAAFPNITRSDLEDGIASLVRLGFVRTSGAVGHHYLTVTPTDSAYLAFDQLARGYDTRADIVLIARLWLTNDKHLSAHKLRERLGWEPRRLNPAISILRSRVPGGLWSNERRIQGLVASISSVTPDARIDLKRIVETGAVD